MSSWVPAVQAGTASSYNDYVTHANLMAIVLHPTKFSKEITKATMGLNLDSAEKPFVHSSRAAGPMEKHLKLINGDFPPVLSLAEAF
jgi:hypothetical protein